MSNIPFVGLDLLQRHRGGHGQPGLHPRAHIAEVQEVRGDPRELHQVGVHRDVDVRHHHGGGDLGARIPAQRQPLSHLQDELLRRGGHDSSVPYKTMIRQAPVLNEPMVLYPNLPPTDLQLKLREHLMQAGEAIS